MSELVSPIGRSRPAGPTTTANAQVDGLNYFRPDDQVAITPERAEVAAILAEDTRPCQRTGCSNHFSRSPGPGRPRRFCSSSCRRADRHDAGKPRLASAPPGFAGILAEAITRSRLTLTEICDRLAGEDGVALARTTLHNWCTGTRPQRRPRLHEQLCALERVLGLRRGTLLLQLDPGTPADDATPSAPEPSVAPRAQVRTLRQRVRRLGGVDGYLTTEVSERCTVSPDRNGHFRQVVQTVLATGEHTDCYWLFAAADHSGEEVNLSMLRSCRLGRKVRYGDVLALELLFDTKLRRGQEHTFGFRLTMPRGPQPVESVRRWTSPPGQPTLDRFELAVTFSTPPLRVFESVWPTETSDPDDRRPVPLDAGTARMALDHPAPAVVGLRWEW